MKVWDRQKPRVGTGQSTANGSGRNVSELEQRRTVARGSASPQCLLSQATASHLLCLLPQDRRKPAGQLCAKALEE